LKIRRSPLADANIGISLSRSVRPATAPQTSAQKHANRHFPPGTLSREWASIAREVLLYFVGEAADVAVSASLIRPFGLENRTEMDSR
jgi:hypothetical protein